MLRGGRDAVSGPQHQLRRGGGRSRQPGGAGLDQGGDQGRADRPGRRLGWMNDFGEALMFDARLYDGGDLVWHNRYPEEWARMSREAIEEAGRGDGHHLLRPLGVHAKPGDRRRCSGSATRCRAGTSTTGSRRRSSGCSRAASRGSACCTATPAATWRSKVSVDGRQIPVIARTPELLMRWMELNAFTAVLRTHEGLDPAVSAQNRHQRGDAGACETLRQRLQGLAAYREGAGGGGGGSGHPVVRHPFLHYPGDPNEKGLRYQFLLGPDLMVAPVLDRGASGGGLLPRGRRLERPLDRGRGGPAGEWARMPAPLGRPAVFLRKGSLSLGDIIDGLGPVGVI